MAYWLPEEWHRNAKSVATQGFQARLARAFVGELGRPRTVGASGVAAELRSLVAKGVPHVQHNCARRQRVPSVLGAS